MRVIICKEPSRRMRKPPMNKVPWLSLIRSAFFIFCFYVTVYVLIDMMYQSVKKMDKNPVKIEVKSEK